MSAAHQLELALDADDLPATRPQILEAVQAVLRLEQAPPMVLEVVVVGDRRIAELNDRYRGSPGPTDVLSFPFSEPGHTPVEGLVVVSSETARRVAVERQHDAAAELILYVIHGCLHLLGYDDQRPQDFSRMHAREEEILSALGYPPIFREPAPHEQGSPARDEDVHRPIDDGRRG